MSGCARTQATARHHGAVFEVCWRGRPRRIAHEALDDLGVVDQQLPEVALVDVGEVAHDPFEFIHLADRTSRDVVSASVRLLDRTDDFVEVATRFPLWDAVPAELRATEQRVRQVKSDYDRRGWLDRLLRHQCAVASSIAGLDGLYLPCPRPVHDDGDLCVLHGGPPRPAKVTREALLRERAELRARLAEFEDRVQPVDAS